MIKRHYQYETCDFPEYRGPLLLYYYYCFSLLRLVIVYMLGLLPFLLSVLLTYTYINTCDMRFRRIQKSIVIIINLLRLVIVYMLGLLPFLLKILMEVTVTTRKTVRATLKPTNNEKSVSNISWAEKKNVKNYKNWFKKGTNVQKWL